MEEIINISGWKGKGNIEINSYDDYYLVIESHKSKETGEYYTTDYKLEKRYVKTLWDIIRNNFEYGIVFKYKYLVRKILLNYKIDIDNIIPNFNKFLKIKDDLSQEDSQIFSDVLTSLIMEAFNGGKFRKYMYFKYLYYPLKVLEAKGLISYLGKGGIMLLGSKNDKI